MRTQACNAHTLPILHAVLDPIQLDGGSSRNKSYIVLLSSVTFSCVSILSFVIERSCSNVQGWQIEFFYSSITVLEGRALVRDNFITSLQPQLQPQHQGSKRVTEKRSFFKDLNFSDSVPFRLILIFVFCLL